MKQNLPRFPKSGGRVILGKLDGGPIDLHWRSIAQSFPNMPTFIDESGETGFGPGSSQFYILAAVYFENASKFEIYEDLAKDLRNSYGHSNNFEFKSSKSGDVIKSNFFDVIKQCEFSYAVSYIDKTQFSKLDKRGVLGPTIAGLVGILEGCFLQAESALLAGKHLNEPIRFDDTTDKVYVQMLKEGFRSAGKERSTRGRLIGDIKNFASHTNLGIQLADMVCGAVADHLKGSSKYYNLIREERRLDLYRVETPKGDPACTESPSESGL